MQHSANHIFPNGECAAVVSLSSRAARIVKIFPPGIYTYRCIYTHTFSLSFSRSRDLVYKRAAARERGWNSYYITREE